MVRHSPKVKLRQCHAICRGDDQAASSSGVSQGISTQNVVAVVMVLGSCDAVQNAGIALWDSVSSLLQFPRCCVPSCLFSSRDAWAESIFKNDRVVICHVGAWGGAFQSSSSRPSKRNLFPVREQHSTPVSSQIANAYVRGAQETPAFENACLAGHR